MAKTKGRKSGFSLIWFIVIVAVGVGAYAGLHTLSRHAGTWEADAELRQNQRDSEHYDNTFLTNKPYGPIYVKLKTYYPDDYVALKTEVINAQRSRAQDRELEAIASNFMHKFLIAHAAEFAAAPAENLKAVRTADLDVMTTIQNFSKQQCAFYFMEGRLPEDLDDITLEAVANLAAVKIDAMAAGRAHPTPRRKATKADHAAFFRAMQRNGLTKAQTRMLAEQDGLEAAGSADQCAIGVIVSRSVIDLPGAVADRLTVEMATVPPDPK